MELNEILLYVKGKDTRTNEDLELYKITKTLSKEKYIELDKEMKKRGCYYSRFAGAFICKTKLDLDAPIKEKEVVERKEKNIKYGRNLLEYISLEEYKAFLKEYAKRNFQHSYAFRERDLTQSEIIEKYEKELLDQMEHSRKYDGFGVLDNIREAIIEKSLGKPKEEFRTSDKKYYLAIWDKIPTIEGLYIDKEKSYTAVWGYDQTNVDIAYQLNTRVWGLDIFRNVDGSYYLVRLKDNRFHDKNGVRNFSYDPQASKTFERDASQTGQYR